MTLVGRTWAALRRLVREEQSYALDGIDRAVDAILRRRDGVFVEAGANDGLAQSNTLFFEEYRGWRGLLVEPIPELFAQCVRNRPRCIVENAALVALDHPARTIRMRYCNLMSTVEAAMKSTEATEAHVALGASVQQLTPYDVEVPARALSTILDERGLRRVDLLSLDVEGYELQALKGIDFTRHRPTFLLIEARFREEVDAFLAGRYRPVAKLSHHDVLYQTVT